MFPKQRIDLTTGRSEDVQPVLVDRHLIDILFKDRAAASLDDIKLSLVNKIRAAESIEQIDNEVSSEIYLLSILNHPNMPKKEPVLPVVLSDRANLSE